MMLLAMVITSVPRRLYLCGAYHGCGSGSGGKQTGHDLVGAVVGCGGDGEAHSQEEERKYPPEPFDKLLWLNQRCVFRHFRLRVHLVGKERPVKQKLLLQQNPFICWLHVQRNKFGSSFVKRFHIVWLVTIFSRPILYLQRTSFLIHDLIRIAPKQTFGTSARNFNSTNGHFLKCTHSVTKQSKCEN